MKLQNQQQQQARDRAAQLLTHYFQLALGERWTADNAAEVEGIIDDLITAAAAPELSAHAEAVQKLAPLDGRD